MHSWQASDVCIALWLHWVSECLHPRWKLCGKPTLDRHRKGPMWLQLGKALLAGHSLIKSLGGWAWLQFSQQESNHVHLNRWWGGPQNLKILELLGTFLIIPIKPNEIPMFHWYVPNNSNFSRILANGPGSPPPPPMAISEGGGGDSKFKNIRIIRGVPNNSNKT